MDGGSDGGSELSHVATAEARGDGECDTDSRSGAIKLPRRRATSSSFDCCRVLEDLALLTFFQVMCP